MDGKATSHYDGTDWEHYRRDKISFISQSYGILPGDTVLGNVTCALRLIGYGKKEALKRAKDALKKVDLWSMRGRRAAKLSSGQKQRLSIARALAKPASVLIADEPTGNLDSENSKNIISLLADAAKTRLVIIITHDYAEVEAYCTRRIVIKDGKIESDTSLRPANKAEATTTETVARKPRLGKYIAAKQMKMHPVWCAIMLTFLAVTAFSVFAFLGTFISAVDDTNTRIYSDSAFRNGTKERIVIQRTDHTDLTDDDINKLLSIPHAVRVERFGYAADVYCHYRKDVDHSIGYELMPVYIDGSIEPEYVSVPKTVLSETAPFLQIIPALPNGTDFLSDGRLPDNYFEAVINESEGSIGDVIPVYIRDEKNWAIDSYLAINVTIVGTTAMEGIYLSDEVGRMLNTKMQTDYNYVYLPRDPASYKDIAENEYPDDVFRATGKCFNNLKQLYKMTDNFDGKYYTFYFLSANDKFVPLRYYGVTTVPNVYERNEEGKLVVKEDNSFEPFAGNNFIEVKHSTFIKLIDEGYGDQVSMYITDYAYADRVIDELNNAGYIAISPYKLGSTKQDPELADKRISTLAICGVATLVILILEMLLLRVLFSMQTGSYKLLADLGLTRKSASRSVLIQLVLLTVTGQIIATVAVFAVESHATMIHDLTKYLLPKNVALLFFVHLIAALIGALWVIASLKKQVFPFKERYSDIAFEEDER